MCNVNAVSRISCFCLIFFLEGIGVALATLATPGYARVPPANAVDKPSPILT